MSAPAATPALNVPLILVPGQPSSFYTVHIHRVRWDDAKLKELGSRSMVALQDAAREDLPRVSGCISAELMDVDLAVIHHPDGATAVARVLCESESCTLAATRHQRDAGEESAAESARDWAAEKLGARHLQILRSCDELSA
ncbi:hypothetical protein [Streptomyces sp. TRM68416]|uniref:hypothetical protein n=1 Tax=Streptomyces sp. TRM68416 TaxID=2758412 RepID=UPI001661CADB|nr:hypothetical protein [Streptomyces sp. TRM68416]MBD0844242.1 hypothetical protein [Streptomyces sp. TRM68416]